MGWLLPDTQHFWRCWPVQLPSSVLNNVFRIFVFKRRSKMSPSSRATSLLGFFFPSWYCYSLFSGPPLGTNKIWPGCLFERFCNISNLAKPYPILRESFVAMNAPMIVHDALFQIPQTLPSPAEQRYRERGDWARTADREVQRDDSE